MSRYIFSPTAKQDLVEINRYLIKFSPAAARRLKDKIQRQCKLLVDFPAMGKKADNLQPGLRSFPLEDYLTLLALKRRGFLLHPSSLEIPIQVLKFPRLDTSTSLHRLPDGV